MKTSQLLIVAVLVPSVVASVRAQTGRRDADPVQNLATFLNDDGTLHMSHGFRGTIDPRGWSLMVGRDRIPRFVRTTDAGLSPGRTLSAGDTADVHWDNRFRGLYGLDGQVLAMAANGDVMYFGGYFTGTDVIAASNIVQWNIVTGEWSTLGAGVDGSVECLAIVGNDLYAGGEFGHAGGAPAHCIARWDGVGWRTLGAPPYDGVSDTLYHPIVLALLTDGSDLYIGGQFTKVADTLNANNIVKWNAGTWTALGNGTDAFVDALAKFKGDLYAGGGFKNAGTTYSRGIARWNGTQWMAVGSPLGGIYGYWVSALLSTPDYLYAGGYFSDIAGKTLRAPNIARWNGSSWFALSGGELDGPVTALVSNGGMITVAGHFSHAGLFAANGVVQWDTLSMSWRNMNLGIQIGTYSTVSALLRTGGFVYAGGSFTSYINSDPTPVNYVARWDGGAWSALGTSASNSVSGGYPAVLALAVSGSDLYVGGWFAAAGDVPANNIAKYAIASNSWSSLGTGPANGVDSVVRTIVVDQRGSVFVGGDFQAAGGMPAHHVAKWDGASWSAVGSGSGEGVAGGTETTVFRLLLYGTDLYVGGEFSSAGGGPASNIARWDGSVWKPLGQGVDRWVYAMAIHGSSLYAGGFFDSAGGALAHSIARWDGAMWHPVGVSPGDGVNGTVHALLSSGPHLYVAGSFTVAGGVMDASNVADWNGNVWHALGDGFRSDLGITYGTDLEMMGGILCATGQFTASGLVGVNNIARWDTSIGLAWEPLGSGLSGAGAAIAVSGDDLFVGGLFSEAGSRPSFRLGRWNPGLVSTRVDEGVHVPLQCSLGQNYPNPFNPTTKIQFTIVNRQLTIVKVYDVLGRDVATLVNEVKQPGTYTVEFNGSNLASGVYFYRLQAGDFVETMRLVLLK